LAPQSGNAVRFGALRFDQTFAAQFANDVQGTAHQNHAIMGKAMDLSQFAIASTLKADLTTLSQRVQHALFDFRDVHCEPVCETHQNTGAEVSLQARVVITPIQRW
jgi:hypothetical protein